MFAVFLTLSVRLIQSEQARSQSLRVLYDLLYELSSTLELSVFSVLHSLVSAFYAECLSKKIQFNAHIWTKSKFLGMSIGVHNIGQGTPSTASYVPKSDFLHTFQSGVQCHDLLRLVSGCVSCLEHDEHYILTFPNGYGRSVLPHS